MNYGVSRLNITNIERHFGKKVIVNKTLATSGDELYVKDNISYDFNYYSMGVEMHCLDTGWRIELRDYERGDGIKEKLFNRGLDYKLTDKRISELEHAKSEMKRLWSTFFTGVEGEHPLNYYDRKDWDYYKYSDYYENGHLYLGGKYMLEDDIKRGIEYIVKTYRRIKNGVWMREEEFNTAYMKALKEHTAIYAKVLAKIESIKLEKERKNESQRNQSHRDSGVEEDYIERYKRERAREEERRIQDEREIDILYPKSNPCDNADDFYMLQFMFGDH